MVEKEGVLSMIIVTCTDGVMGLPEEYYFTANELTSFSFNDILEMLKIVKKRKISYSQSDIKKLENLIKELKDEF